jgi:hypothetical protein
MVASFGDDLSVIDRGNGHATTLDEDSRVIRSEPGCAAAVFSAKENYSAARANGGVTSGRGLERARRFVGCVEQPRKSPANLTRIGACHPQRTCRVPP